jgi:diadenosine tetraphosphate (Ap4A) HIT family hydrolase
MGKERPMAKVNDFLSIPQVKERTFSENELAFAFLTNIPITPGHTLISPKRIVATIDELTPDELKAVYELLLTVKKVLKKEFDAEGFNFAWNEGERYGQSVPHFHLHVVPRSPGDDGITEYEPRKFLYRPGSRETTPEAELADIARILRKDSR